MAGPTRALGRAPDVDPYGFPARDAPASGPGGPRPRPRPGPGNGGGPPRRDGPSGERPAKKRSIIWRWRRAFFLLALLGLLVVAAGAAVLARTELPEGRTFDQASFICAADLPAGQKCTEANAMSKLQGDDANRVNVSYDDLSPNIINAVVAVEDRDFFEHDGVAPLGIARALFRDLKGDPVQQGGSTITQQYVKNAYLSPERALTRKLKEAVLSIKLEQRMSKEEILERYLNTVYFGRWSYGIQAASQAYFHVDAHDLSIGQAAYLAGLIRAPEAADATLHPQEARRRRRTALVSMSEEGYITQDEAHMVNASSFSSMGFLERQAASQLVTKKGKEVGTEYITAYVVELLKKEPFNLTEQEIYGGGYRVYTSIDLDMQGRAYQAVTGVLDRPEDPAASLVSVDDQGLIRAMVGGRDFKANPYNYAISGRPVGSTFKPIALSEAIATGHSLESKYNAPKEIVIPPYTTDGGVGCDEWTVHNYSESEEGVYSLMEATAQSSNTAYAQLMVDLGPDKVLDMAQRLGMPEFDLRCPTMVLGTENASAVNMAGVYSVFANRGLKKTPSIITRVERVGDEGQITPIYTRPADPGTAVLTPQQADLVTHTLEGVINGGTGHDANIGRPAAGKTGTSQENKDAWFVGYVPKLTTAVWMGYPNADWPDPENDNKLSIPPMAARSGHQVHGITVTGGSLPARMWHDFMLSVTDARGMNDPFTEVSEDVVQSGTRLDHPDVTATTMGLPQPGGPGPGGGNGDGGTRPTRPGHGNSTTTSTSSTTTSSSTTTTTTPPPTTSTTVTVPTIPGGGGGGRGG